jgi:hypothetical protein
VLSILGFAFKLTHTGETTQIQDDTVGGRPAARRPIGTAAQVE